MIIVSASGRPPGQLAGKTSQGGGNLGRLGGAGQKKFLSRQNWGSATNVIGAMGPKASFDACWPEAEANKACMHSALARAQHTLAVDLARRALILMIGQVWH